MTTILEQGRQVPAGDLTSKCELSDCAQATSKTAQTPKLWAAIAAVEIEALGRPSTAVIDAILEHRLEQLGGTRAVERYGRAIAGADEDYRSRAWLLGELETLGELALDGGGLPDDALAWVSEVRAAHDADLAGLRIRLAGVSDEVAQLRQRLFAAGQQVLGLVAAKAAAVVRAEAAERRAAAAEGYLEWMRCQGAGGER